MLVRLLQTHCSTSAPSSPSSSPSLTWPSSPPQNLQENSRDLPGDAAGAHVHMDVEDGLNLMIKRSEK